MFLKQELLICFFLFAHVETFAKNYLTFVVIYVNIDF